MEESAPQQRSALSGQRYAVVDRVIEITRKNRIGTIIMAHQPEDVPNGEWEYSILWESVVQMPPIKVKQSEIVQVLEAS